VTVDRLLDLAQRSRVESALLAAELDRRRGLPPAAGDLFVCAATRDLPVEWLVLERGTGQPGTWLVLIADANPLLGDSDVAVPAGASAGPLSLRCRYGVWVAESDLDPELRTGRISSEDVRRTLGRHRSLTRAASGLALAGEDAADPEYESWVLEVLVPAHAALAGAQGGRPGRDDWALRRGTETGVRPLPYLLTAAALSLLILGLGAVAVWQWRTIEHLAREGGRLGDQLRREETAVHDAQRQARTYRNELEKTARDAQTAHRAEAERTAALEQWHGASPLSGEPVANVPFLWLQPHEAVRGEAGAITRPAHSPILVVILELGESIPAPVYRLEVLRQGEPAAIWRVGGLVRTGPTELSVALPTRLLAPGKYRLRLYRQPGGAAAPVGEFTIAIRPG
jgi:hypothetical protein